MAEEPQYVHAENHTFNIIAIYCSAEFNLQNENLSLGNWGSLQILLFPIPLLKHI